MSWFSRLFSGYVEEVLGPPPPPTPRRKLFVTTQGSLSRHYPHALSAESFIVNRHHRRLYEVYQDQLRLQEEYRRYVVQYETQHGREVRTRNEDEEEQRRRQFQRMSYVTGEPINVCIDSWV
jgi:hypothetical protein